MRFLVLIHRYLGIGLCLLFAMWFASGMVMVFVPYPALTEAERFSGLSALDMRGAIVSPHSAFIASGLPGPLERVRLTMVMNRPVYHFHPLEGGVVSVFAYTGMPMPGLDAQQATLAAKVFGRAEKPKHLDTSDYDQWTVPNEFDPFRPFHRIALDDAEGSQVYVSQRSGEIIRDTTAMERGWNYVGSVAHWIYPAILRKHRDLWAEGVWWLSLAGVIGAITGIALGILRFRFAGTYKSGKRSPFQGWMYWHHVLGIGCAIFVLAWIASGWLSLDDGRLFSEPYLTAAEQERFAGGALDLERFDRDWSLLAHPGEEGKAPKEIEFVQVGAEPFVILRHGPTQGKIIAGRSGDPRSWDFFEPDLLANAGAATISGASLEGAEMLEGYDDYYYNRFPLPVLRLRFSDPNETWIHIDPRNGKLLDKMDRSRRAYRWAYSALHTLDFPFFAKHVSLWYAAIIGLCSLGFLFSVTGIVIGWRRIRGS